MDRGAVLESSSVQGKIIVDFSQNCGWVMGKAAFHLCWSSFAEAGGHVKTEGPI